jgi:Tat protein translocase TatB subunit
MLSPPVVASLSLLLRNLPMFGIGMSELLVILALALIIIGPKRLPDIAHALGKGLAEFKRATEDLKNTINEETSTTETSDHLVEEGKIQPPGAAPAEESPDVDDAGTAQPTAKPKALAAEPAPEGTSSGAELPEKSLDQEGESSHEG